MAPGAVPVIHYSDDEESVGKAVKKPSVGLIDDPDEFDEFETIARLHKASGNGPNFDNMFAHHQADYPKDQDYSDDCNSATNLDSGSNIENEFNILRYLEDKNELAEDSPDCDATLKSRALQVQKKLDPLFKQEVPLTNLYFDHEDEDTISQPKQTSSDLSIPYFPSELGRFD